MARCPVCDVEITPGCNCDVNDSTWLVWTAGTIEPVLSADPDQLLTCTADGLDAQVPTSLKEPPACMVYRTSNLSVANNTLTSVPFNVELYDTDTMHSTLANTERITFTTAGVYVVTFEAVWNKNATG